jgi:hypothetical protein
MVNRMVGVEADDSAAMPLSSGKSWCESETDIGGVMPSHMGLVQS